MPTALFLKFLMVGRAHPTGKLPCSDYISTGNNWLCQCIYDVSQGQTLTGNLHLAAYELTADSHFKPILQDALGPAPVGARCPDLSGCPYLGSNEIPSG